MEFQDQGVHSQERKMLPPPGGTLHTRDELLKHVHDFALTQGYMVCIRDSAKDRYVTIAFKNGEHNHEPSKDISEHPSCRRFTDEEVLMIRDLTVAGKRPRQILKFLRQRNPNLVSDSRNVYNVKAKIRGESLSEFNSSAISLA
ncbi:methylmalonate-semialdehyde dehydrogenase [Corchorus olitorius]|uniref:Methylmalonate-semialdehyde dehydrogenase n=1 Tax=Corchorus olitorius TaxID=93759 RepID=A0A1R3G9P7_9ROSI|nr:methylmalonate-semialdehyde dehydrogenase [Corchorus olitorius]